MGGGLRLVALVGIVGATGAATAGALADLTHATGGPQPRFSAAYSFDARGGMPIEGSVSYVVLRRKPGGTVLRAELRGDLATRAVSAPVGPGRYRISAYQRLCSGTCERLDAPSHGCGRDVRVPAGGSIRAAIRVRWTPANATDQPHCRLRISR